VDKQNCRYRFPNITYERRLYCAEAGLRCATPTHGIICPCLFENAEGPTLTMNAERYWNHSCEMSYIRISSIFCGSDKTKQLLTHRDFRADP
jgi:hypothetical protein